MIEASSGHIKRVDQVLLAANHRNWSNSVSINYNCGHWSLVTNSIPCQCRQIECTLIASD